MKYLVCGFLLMPCAAMAQDSDALAKAAQNPVAAMISLPFQNNTFFGVANRRASRHRSETRRAASDRGE